MKVEEKSCNLHFSPRRSDRDDLHAPAIARVALLNTVAVVHAGSCRPLLFPYRILPSAELSRPESRKIEHAHKNGIGESRIFFKNKRVW